MKHTRPVYGTTDPEALRYLREFQRGSNRIRRIFGIPERRIVTEKKP